MIDKRNESGLTRTSKDPILYRQRWEEYHQRVGEYRFYQILHGFHRVGPQMDGLCLHPFYNLGRPQ